MLLYVQYDRITDKMLIDSGALSLNTSAFLSPLFDYIYWSSSCSVKNNRTSLIQSTNSQYKSPSSHDIHSREIPLQHDKT